MLVYTYICDAHIQKKRRYVTRKKKKPKSVFHVFEHKNTWHITFYGHLHVISCTFPQFVGKYGIPLLYSFFLLFCQSSVNFTWLIGTWLNKLLPAEKIWRQEKSSPKKLLQNIQVLCSGKCWLTWVRNCCEWAEKNENGKWLNKFDSGDSWKKWNSRVIKLGQNSR